MVEVFKTNVNTLHDAKELVAALSCEFKNYKVNFDLQDCDRILRVEYTAGEIHPEPIIALLASYGYAAEILPDTLIGSLPRLLSGT